MFKCANAPARWLTHLSGGSETAFFADFYEHFALGRLWHGLCFYRFCRGNAHIDGAVDIGCCSRHIFSRSMTHGAGRHATGPSSSLNSVAAFIPVTLLLFLEICEDEALPARFHLRHDLRRQALHDLLLSAGHRLARFGNQRRRLHDADHRVVQRHRAARD